ncbi:MAG: DNA-binding protein [Bdellovibrio sp.]|nr:MAG: DNA-binding protein [Bdellovibrio sp.]
MKKKSEKDLLLSQVKCIAEGLAKTFSPFCEVVVHDFSRPKNAVAQIHNNLSGRKVGSPTTELGIARMKDPDFQQIIANYANKFADGRQVKSTSIGIKDSSGKYVGALCLNIDLTLFHGFQSAIQRFTAIDSGLGAQESLDPAGAGAIRAKIDDFAARLASTPRALKAKDRKTLLQELKASGFLDVRRSMEIVAECLGVSRAAVYNYAK